MLNEHVGQEFDSPLCRRIVSWTGMARLSVEDPPHLSPRLSGYALFPPVRDTKHRTYEDIHRMMVLPTKDGLLLQHQFVSLDDIPTVHHSKAAHL